MWRLRLIPDVPNVQFIRRRLIFFLFSAFLAVGSVILLVSGGINLGIDFAGGVLIEVKAPGLADLGRMRGALGGLGLGEVQLQEFGEPEDVLIRIERQAGGAEAQGAAVEKVKKALLEELGEGADYRRVEFVGPKVGSELIRAGVLAVVISIAAMLVYVWFRFELPFGIAAVAALLHDMVTSVGVFALTGFEFNLSIVAALLLIVGYSMNDTVVVFDRVRENLRKYKTMALPELLNRSLNETLSRTVITGGSTLLALLSLFIFGGEVIRGFSFAMIWGVLVGTYSSVFIATPLLLYLRLKRVLKDEEAKTQKA